MSESADQSQRMELAVQFLQRDVQNLMARGTQLEIELALKQAEIDRLTKENAELQQPKPKAIKKR